jgi:hypothetical protein
MMLAVGSANPRGFFCGLLVRRGKRPPKTSLGSMPPSVAPPSRMRSEATAIAERLADQCQPRLPDPFGKIRPQLLAPYARRLTAEVVVGVHLPPGVEDRPAWRLLQQA